MTLRRFATLLRHAVPRTALLLMLALTAACGSLAGPTENAPALSADYRNLVAKRLKLFFKDTIQAGVEIPTRGGPSPTRAGAGWYAFISRIAAINAHMSTS
jgi:hypothetical protein